jgi:hypothetical protein
MSQLERTRIRRRGDAPVCQRPGHIVAWSLSVCLGGACGPGGAPSNALDAVRFAQHTPPWGYQDGDPPSLNKRPRCTSAYMCLP